MYGMLKLKVLNPPAMLVAVCACGSAGPAQEQLPAKEISGFEGVEFGTDLQIAIGQFGADRFNPASVVGCLEEATIDSCHLFPAEDAPPFVRREGVPYTLSLEFDASDKLIGFDLEYEPREKSDVDDCLDFHLRTVDWLSSEFGPLEPNGRRDSETGSYEDTTTKAGHPVSIWRSNAGGFVSDLRSEEFSDGELFVLSVFLGDPDLRKCSIDVMFGKKEASTPTG